MINGMWKNSLIGVGIAIVGLVIGVPQTALASISPTQISQITTAHPRIFLNAGNLATIRTKAANTFAADYQTLVGQNNGMSEAFRYLMKGDEADARAALSEAYSTIASINTSKSGGSNSERAISRNIYTLALIYDWIYNSPSVTTTDKAAIRAGMMSGIDWLDCRDTSGVQYNCSSAPFPFGAYITNPRYWDSHPAEINGQVAVALIAMTHDFTPSESSLQTQEESFASTVLTNFTAGWLATFQKIMYSDGGWWMGSNYDGVNLAPQYSAYAAIQSSTGQNYFTEYSFLEKHIYQMLYTILDPVRGIIMSEEDTPQPYFRAPHYKLALIISHFYQNGYAKWIADQIYGPWRATYPGITEDYSEDLIFKILFEDTNVTSTPPNNLPLNAAFAPLGFFISRTGWGVNDTVTLIRNTTMYQETHETHANPQFTIYKSGWLALNGGHYEGSPDHNTYYYHRNISRNSVMIGYKSDGNSFVGTGNPFAIDPFATPYGSNVYEGTRDYTYVRSDVTKAYQKATFPAANQPNQATDICLHCQRTFLYLTGIWGWDDPVLITADDYYGTGVYDKAWLLHMENFPTVSGNTITNTQGAGKLITKSLLSSSVAIRTVGGTGNEYTTWNGTNYPTDPTKTQCNDCKWGKYRIEISPVSNHQRDNFLQVMMPTAATNASSPTVNDLSNTDLMVTQINNKIAVFERNTTSDLTAATYTIPDVGYTILDHYLTQVVPNGVYRINGNLYTASKNGVLAVSLPHVANSTYTVSYTGTTATPVDNSYYYPVSFFNTPSGTPTPTPVPTPNPDVNRDGQVNGQDVQLLLSKFETNTIGNEDIDANGRVNALDFGYVAKSFTNGLWSYWNLNEGSGVLAHDLSGNVHDATLTNGATWNVSGRLGSAVSLDGINDYLFVNNGPVAGNSAFSIAFWFKTTATVRERQYDERSNSNTNTVLTTSVNEDVAGDAAFDITDDAGVNAFLTAGALNLNNGNWHHYAVVQSSRNARQLFIDGVLKASDATSLGQMTPNLNRIGANALDGSRPFAGSLDDIRLYNRALTPAEIASLAVGNIP